MTDLLIRRLTEPPFGTETSERNLMASVAFGNRNHGKGSHWIERYENGAWAKLEETP